jgi:ribosome-binding ATPase YchF (GTP1/OBG family)
VADLYQKVKTELESGQIPSLTDEERDELKDLNLLSLKPVMYLFNVSEADLTDSAKQKQLAEIVAPYPALFVNAKLEEELSELDEADALSLIKEYGFAEPGLNRVISSAYQLLGLQSYLTAGPKEIRAWTIKTGSSAPQAAGVIHTDFERGFIAAKL